MARPDSDPAKAGTPRTESNTRKHRTAATSHRTAHTTTTKRTKASKTSKGSNSNSTLPTTSFVTSTNSLETAPTSSIYQQSSSSIHWGPATTAHALSPEKTFSSASRPHSQTSGFSDGSKKAVIAATTIGGVVILVLLIYTLWRKRQGATYSEIVRFRPHSGTIVLSQSRDERLTALPIYRESRYSVRSSKLGSTLSLNKAAKRPSGVPPLVLDRFHKQNPWVQNMWKTSNPPTPTRKAHPLSQAMAMPDLDQPERPEMTRVYSSNSAKSGLTIESVEALQKPGPSISVEPATAAEDTPTTEPTTSGRKVDNEDRWSWTNSQAPPTPRIYATSRHSSLSSLPKFKTIKSWVKSQAERQSTRIHEQGPPTRTAPMPMLLNKASKPNLAPRPTRKLSKRSVRKESLGETIQPNDVTTPARPSSARLRDSCTQNTIEHF